MKGKNNIVTINKLEGIGLMRLYQFPTVNLISIEELLCDSTEINMDLSIRLSPKQTSNTRNVFQPSIHNIREKKVISDFVLKYSSDFNVFAHRTVEPELIGTASRYSTFYASSLYMDTYKDWGKRAKQLVHNSMIVPVYGNRFLLSAIEMKHDSEVDRKAFLEVFSHLRKIPFETYNVEFAFEKGILAFSELTID